jgi:CysZ protein
VPSVCGASVSRDAASPPPAALAQGGDLRYRPVVSTFIPQLFRGATYPWRAVLFLHRHRLWRQAGIAVGINILLLGAVMFALVSLAWPWLVSLDARTQAMAADGEVVRVALTLLKWAVWILVMPLVLVASAVVVLLLGGVVAAPFLDMLSERVEQLVIGTAPAPWNGRRAWQVFLFGLTDILWSLAFLVAIYVPLLVVGFIPGIGALASLVGGSLLLAQEFVGMPLARRMMPYRARWRIILDHKWLALGFGAMSTLFLMVPGLNLLLLPVASTAGTLLFCDLLRTGRVEAPAPPS